MTVIKKNLGSNPSSLKKRFAVKFLRAMKNLNKKRSPPSPSHKHKRFKAIRAAAYESMASAVGPRRAWSRAVLRKIRNRRQHGILVKRSRTQLADVARRKGVRSRVNPRQLSGFVCSRQENGLRGLVPGGGGMDFCRLLYETGHYIKCLRAQVQVMKNIVDHCSN